MEAARCRDYRERRGDTGAESDVYECLIKICHCTYQWETHFTDHNAGLFCLLSKYFLR